MTRSRRAGPASAMREARAARNSLSELAPMTFLVFEDNAGAYRWTIVAGDGETLVQSAGFASHGQARQAARIVYRGASQASFEGRSGATPLVDLAARRGGSRARDALDAERWLDEGGSFNGQAVSR
jgi:uncharacterized protein YegP (UPF0339 family)